MRCCECRFYHRDSEIVNVHRVIGECRFNPPVVMMVPINPDVVSPYTQSHWPIVGLDDWCGKFEATVRR